MPSTPDRLGKQVALPPRLTHRAPVALVRSPGHAAGCRELADRATTQRRVRTQVALASDQGLAAVAETYDRLLASSGQHGSQYCAATGRSETTCSRVGPLLASQRALASREVSTFGQPGAADRGTLQPGAAYPLVPCLAATWGATVCFFGHSVWATAVAYLKL